MAAYNRSVAYRPGRFMRPWMDSPWTWSLAVYAGYRALLTVWMALASTFKPLYEREQAISLLPGTSPLGPWLERVFLWPNQRYDVFWYVGIAKNGYDGMPAGATAFHPLLPLAMRGSGWLLGGNYLLGGWLVAQICCVAMLTLLFRLVRLDYDAGVARRATILLMGSPFGFVFLLPYTEVFLVMCCVGALYAARQERWWLAGLAGAGAALSKQTGAVIILPLLYLLWQQVRADPAKRRLGWLASPGAALLLIPLALLSFFVYRASLADVAFDWSRPLSLMSLLVTPDIKQVWHTSFGWPWQNVILAANQIIQGLFTIRSAAG